MRHSSCKLEVLEEAEDNSGDNDVSESYLLLLLDSILDSDAALATNCLTAACPARSRLRSPMLRSRSCMRSSVSAILGRST